MRLLRPEGVLLLQLDYDCVKPNVPLELAAQIAPAFHQQGGVFTPACPGNPRDAYERCTIFIIAFPSESRWHRFIESHERLPATVSGGHYVSDFYGVSGHFQVFGGDSAEKH